MDNEEIQQLHTINFLSEQNNAKVLSYSSELQNAQAVNILSSTRKNIWMSEEDISKLAERPKFFKCVAFDCWHDYKTNPSIIEFLVSTDNVKDYITWSTIYLELKEGLQVFQIDPLGRRYDYIKIQVKETYGGAKTYLNQIMLFEDNPFGNKQQLPQQGQQQVLQSNSLAHIARGKANAQDLSMNLDSEIDEKFFNQARLNIPKPFSNQVNNQMNSTNTLNTQGNNLITQTNQTLPDQNNIMNLPHPANLPSINYPMNSINPSNNNINSDRRGKHISVNSIKKRSLISSPSEELLNYQTNIHQSGGGGNNNTQHSLAGMMGMNGQFFHTPSHSNHNLNSNHHLQSNQGTQPLALDSLQKQLYNIQQQSIPGSNHIIQSGRVGMNNQPQIMTSDLEQIQQNLNLKLQNMNKEIMQLQSHDQTNDIIMDNSGLTPVNQDHNYAELHKHLFGNPNSVLQQQQLPQSRDPSPAPQNNIHNNLFEKVNTSQTFKPLSQQDAGGQLMSNKTSQISQMNNNYNPHNISQHSNQNAMSSNQYEESTIPSHLLTQSEKEVLSLKKTVQKLIDENVQKDTQVKKLEQTVLKLQYTCQNLMEKLDSLENKFENFKQFSKNQPSFRKTLQTEEREDDRQPNTYVLETNQKQHFPLNSPQTFGKNFTRPQNTQHSSQKYEDQNEFNQNEQDKYLEQYDTQNEKINKIIEQKLDQFQKVVVNTLKKNFTSNNEQDEQEYQTQGMGNQVRSSQNMSQNRHKPQPQLDNYDKQKTNKSRQNSNNSRSQKASEYYQPPPTFNSNSRSEQYSSNQRLSHNQSGLDQYQTAKNMGNRSYSNHSQSHVPKSYRSLSKQQQLQSDYNDRQNVPLTQVQSNKQLNTEPNNRSRAAAANSSEHQSSNPRVIKLLEKLQEKLTIRQKKVDQLNSGKKNKQEYYDRDFDDISDIQDGASSGQQSRLFD